MTRFWHNGLVAMSKGGTWQDHLDRGSPGGQDFPLPVGTPAYAPDSGTLRFRTSPATEGGGQALEVVRDDGVILTLFHASSAVGVALNGPGRRVQKNERAGASGGAKGTPSQGRSNGPHMHEHGKVNGRRVPLGSIPDIAPTGGGGSGSINEGDLTMRNIRNSAGIISTVGEESAEVVAANAWPAVRATWGDYVQLADDEYNGQVMFALRRRAEKIADQAKATVALIPSATLPDDLVDQIVARLEGEFADKIAGAVAIDLDEDRDTILARLDAIDEAVKAVDVGTIDEDDIASLRAGLAALPAAIRVELGRGLLTQAP
jgi:murein DD-endopeptidase MepM/ murein hydrolase activator NlpD